MLNLVIPEKVTAIDKRVMGRLASKYEADLTYVFAVLKRTGWNAEQAELEIRTGSVCQQLIDKLANEFNRDLDDVRKLLDSVNWNVGEARRFAQQNRAWRLPGEQAKARGNSRENRTGLHEDKKKLVCTFCQMSFNRMRFFEAHVKSHEGVKPFKCGSCDCEFVLEEHLAIHVQAHIDRCYSCDLCSGTYTRREHLIRHMNIHARHSKKQMKDFITRKIKEIREKESSYRGSVKKAVSLVNKQKRSYPSQYTRHIPDKQGQHIKLQQADSES